MRLVGLLEGKVRHIYVAQSLGHRQPIEPRMANRTQGYSGALMLFGLTSS